MSIQTPSLQITSLLPGKTSATRILCFGCRVPSDDVQDSTSIISNDDINDDFIHPLKIHKLNDHPTTVLPPSMEFLENVGIVGTVTLLGRSTAMVWVGWGRLQDSMRQHTSTDATLKNVGAAANLSMGPLMVSLPRKSYQGAFASDVPSSKLIGVDDLERDLVASQMSERLSQQLQMAVLVSCYFDDALAPKSLMRTGENFDLDHHMLRRRALTVAEKEICQLIEQHKAQ